MLVTFSSEAYANVTLFADVGKKLLALMGCADTPSGAISADSVQAALVRLEKALVKEKEVSTVGGNKRNADVGFGDEKVSLAMRALPLMEMLRAAVKEKSNVWWETK